MNRRVFYKGRKMKKTTAFLTLLACMIAVSAQNALGTVILTPQVRIVVHPNEPQPVHRAVGDLQRDIQKVLGQSPVVVNSLSDVPSGSSAIVVVGTAWSTSELPVATDITGTEAHAVYVARAGDTPHIILHGSDMRGTIYAIYTFSQNCLGVPPLWLWASWSPQTKTQIGLPDDYNLRFGPPDVRWRAWFPNDQRQLAPWRARNQDNYTAYAETMLRLKLNVLDTGVFLNSSFSSLYQLIGEVEMAQRFGLAVTGTHNAPLGALPSIDRWNNYWTRIRQINPPPVRSIYDKASLISYWKYHIEAVRHHNIEVVWPIGFRGGSDAAFWEGDNFEDPGTDELRAQVIEDMLHEQILLLKSETGLPNPPMRVTLYNEMSNFVAAGLLDLPAEPSLIYNFTAARRDHYPPPDLLNFDFDTNQLAGYYFNYQFTSTGSHIVQAEGPRKMEQNLRAVDAKSKTGVEFSVVNAGNIREHVMELSANAEMMWNFDTYDSSQFLMDFSTLYFGQQHAAAIARLCSDYYAAYWQQMPPVLPGFERQFIFQDLRLHRAMQALTNELKKTTPNLNPFATGDWFRIDPAYHGVATQVEAVTVGLRQSLSRLIPLTRRADEIYAALPPSTRTFFNDNFRVQAYFLRHASEVVYYLAEAVVAQHQALPSRRARAIRLAAQAAQKMEDILSEAEHDRFVGWYNPLRHAEISSVFNLRERRDAIIELLVGLKVSIFKEDFEQGIRDGWYKTPDHESFSVEVGNDAAADSIIQHPDHLLKGFHYVAWEAERYDNLIVGNSSKSEWSVVQNSSGSSGLYADSVNYFGGGYLYASEKAYNPEGSNYAVFTITFTRAGEYTLFMRAAAFDGGNLVANADSLYVSPHVSGYLISNASPTEVISGSGFQAESGTTGLTDRWVWYRINKKIRVTADDLAAGGQYSFVLKIGAREGGCSMDAIAMVATSDFGTLTAFDLDTVFKPILPVPFPKIG